MLPVSKASSDDFQTPEWVLNSLIPYLNKEWVIWECAAGKGNLSKRLEKEGFFVISSDIRDGRNFLKWEPDSFDIVLTNPPYSLKNEFLERAYSLKKPFAFLLPLTTLETKKRQSLFKKYGLEIILLPRRVNFETPSGRGSGSWFATAWFTHRLNIGKELTFSDV